MSMIKYGTFEIYENIKTAEILEVPEGVKPPLGTEWVKKEGVASGKTKDS